MGLFTGFGPTGMLPSRPGPAAVTKKPARTTLSWPQCRAATAEGRRFGDCLNARCAPAGKVIVQGVHTNSTGAASKRRAGGKGFLGAAFVVR